tara:strand:+ start:124 stop:492 length:369 start_codon:yes stop_codon:yes gene_type:complete
MNTRERRQLTQCDKHDVCLPIQLAKTLATVVKGKIDSAPKNSATVTIREPVRKVFPTVLGRWVTKHDGTFGSPEEASCDATCCRTDVDEPFSPMAIILTAPSAQTMSNFFGVSSYLIQRSRV